MSTTANLHAGRSSAYPRKGSLALGLATFLILAATPLPGYCANPDLAHPELLPSTYTGSGQDASTLQIGRNNYAQIGQSATANTSQNARINQIGSHNVANITQNGLQDQAIAAQYGSGNTANIVQTGSNDAAISNQYGTGNNTGIVQSASNVSATVNVVGVGNNAFVLQTRSGAAPVNVNAFGVGKTVLYIQ